MPSISYDKPQHAKRAHTVASSNGAIGLDATRPSNDNHLGIAPTNIHVLSVLPFPPSPPYLPFPPTAPPRAPKFNSTQANATVGKLSDSPSLPPLPPPVPRFAVVQHPNCRADVWSVCIFRSTARRSTCFRMINVTFVCAQRESTILQNTNMKFELGQVT